MFIWIIFQESSNGVRQSGLTLGTNDNATDGASQWRVTYSHCILTLQDDSQTWSRKIKKTKHRREEREDLYIRMYHHFYECPGKDTLSISPDILDMNKSDPSYWPHQRKYTLRSSDIHGSEPMIHLFVYKLCSKCWLYSGDCEGDVKNKMLSVHSSEKNKPKYNCRLVW